MNALRRVLVSTTSSLLFACTICRQQTAPEKAGTKPGSEQPPTSVRINGYWSAPPFNEPVVKGAPYSAEEVTDRVQILADGTHIAQTTQVVKVYRDSEGRSRREWFVGANKPSEGLIVWIIDPVSGFRYLLDTYNHVAHRFSPPERTNEPAQHSQEARAVTQGADAMKSPAVKPPAVGTNRPQASTESLGAQFMEGISAEGQKTTSTIPAGSIGNDRPLVSVSERWFSRELHVPVMWKTSDPRNGETTTHLRNIDRAEPDPALFGVPSDYEIVDEQHNGAEIKIP